MRKQLLDSLKYGLFCGCMWISFNGYSQVIASVKASQQQTQPKSQQKTILLTHLLTELENRYQVRFNYSVDLLKGVQVSVEDIRKYKSIDRSLNQLLEKSTQLKCKKIDKGTYVIVRSKENASSSAVETEAVNLPGNQMAGNTPSEPSRTQTPALTAAQAIKVSGLVTGENDEPMVGVSVSEKGTTNGTVTDAQGKFTLNVADEKSILVFSFIGYITDEIAVGTQSQLTIKLLPDLKALQEVVVVAYGTQRRTDLTGAVGLVNPADAKKVQSASVAEQLQGRVAGVQVTTSGEPGATSQVRIRGVGTFTGGNPIWVIDGVILEGSYPDFNPNDVETIQVLKDASATALYGSRGMNGVVIVTTKKGQPGGIKIDYSGYYGVQNITKRLPYVGADEFRRLATEAYSLAGKPAPGFTPGVDTDWQEELIKPGVQTDHNVSVSGGSEKSTFLVSAGYFSQDGTIVGPWYKRYSFRVNSDMTKGRLHVGESIYLAHIDQRRVNGLPFEEVARMWPTIPVYDPNEPSGSGFGYGNQNNNTFGTNPIGLQLKDDNLGKGYKMQGSTFAEFKITDFLTYKLLLGLDFYLANDKFITGAGSLRQNNPAALREVSDNRNIFFNTLVENTLNFRKTFGLHTVSALAGYTRQSLNEEYLNSTIAGIPSRDFPVQGAGTANPRTGGSQIRQGIVSWLGRLDYSFHDRYLLQANFRADASSRFPSNNRWGFFPSVSAGWRISQESFFQGVRLFDELKLRASYGTVGNQAIAPYQLDPIIAPNRNYIFGPGQSLAEGAVNINLVNPNLRWEKKTTTNIGVDATILNGRLDITADYYIAKSKDLLLQIPISLTSGNEGDNPYANIAGITNRGLELSINYRQKIGELSLNVGLTGSRNRIVVDGLIPPATPGDPEQPLLGWGPIKVISGRPMSSFYAYVAQGIYQTQAEIDASPLNNKADLRPGDVRYKDRDGNGEINDNDREEVGSPYPLFEYGLNLGANFKGFDLTAYFQGVGGNYLYNQNTYWTARADEVGAIRSDRLPWTEPGSTNKTPIFRQGPSGRNPEPNSTRFIEKGDYFRMKTLQIGYSLPQSFLDRVKGISRARIYVNGQNLFTLTKYTGYNPEVSGAFGSAAWNLRGIDLGNYPTPRTLSIGLQATF